MTSNAEELLKSIHTLEIGEESPSSILQKALKSKQAFDRVGLEELYQK
jgi:hypothetical protein